ncbi:uncharacterized protein TNCV_3727561 [Trichonephila clavipes]|uniref:Uncharacterized protein n=1 Tax=Trichonephila clavipes TaxID=2585209 RepID=A0A8X6RBB1_TRICX|nr:uncharacterized protein TNCV_3727561 [Trichonephila clavipes]
MIHGDAYDFGIAAIPGNRGNGQFDGHWLALVMKHVGMRKIDWLTQHRHVASKKQNDSSGEWLALYMVEERDVRGHSMGQSLFMRALHVLFQSPFPRLETHDAPRHRYVTRSGHRPRFPKTIVVRSRHWSNKCCTETIFLHALVSKLGIFWTKK